MSAYEKNSVASTRAPMEEEPMKLLIVGKPFPHFALEYRGTYRSVPSYQEHLATDHLANQLFHWYCDEGGEEGTVHNLDNATTFLSMLTSVERDEQYELIEVTLGTLVPETASEFLGFDLSTHDYYSLLSWGLDGETYHAPPPEDAKHTGLQPLLTLLRHYFQPQLNRFGLFDSFEAAQFCLNCMDALQHIQPGLWEHEQTDFEVIEFGK